MGGGAPPRRTLVGAMTVYLDHAATTPMLPAAVEAMTAQLGTTGNPSSLHASGPARPPGRGGVPGDDRAGAELPSGRGGLHLRRHRVRQPRAQGPLLVAAQRRPAPVADPHHAGRAPRRARPAALAGRPARAPSVELLPVDRAGPARPRRAARAASSATPESVALVSVMWANNEVGTLQPIAEVVEIAAAHGIPVHTDAVQAVGAVPGRLRRLRRRRADADRAQGRRAVRRRRARRTP